MNRREFLHTSAVTIAATAGLHRLATAGAQGPAVPLFEGLGKHTRTVTTASPQAQRYFNQGLNFLYAFNHDEAIRSFTEAARLDPACAMAHWGVAVANGPHINFPMVPPDRAKAAWAALTPAKENVSNGTEAEKALVEALAKRYADPQPEDRKPLDEAYAAAMTDVWKRFPKDADVGALTAESLMDLRPWDLWTLDGQAQPGAPDIVSLLEAVMAVNPDHPLALHLYIHAVEASPNPEKADAPADRLRDLCPGLGHLVHMPSHIDVRRGRWGHAVEANRKAIAADTEYRKLSPRQNFYRLYMAHNAHMMGFAHMMRGESKAALDTVRAMIAAVPADWTKEPMNAAIADGFLAAPIEVLMRFGRWDDVLKEPEPDERFPIARTLRHMARGVAYAATGNVPEAREAQKAFRAAAGKTPKEARFGNNAAADLFAVAEALLEGEILVRDRKVKEGIESLRAAAKAEDKLRYDEPPDWIHPVRHPLGAVLLRSGAADEAERVYREDLARWPHNGWSLYGLARCLEVQGKPVSAAEVQKQFVKAWEHADVKLTSSCFCVPDGR